ncbi:hypothetical protein SeMB42_g01931 [Synchytrium endobioticum]|uniref:NAD(P)-binding domain-containing protein n=1 Tax=Synchytrium endobioticum TaxID=286115 RepID=A0A507DAH8_9FUNG|nr:hypothetical protein SeLEV6574_g01913 [Synchytrium endobioticum]TPX51419.1 hypothetical protein SeMB42_g01931 [Synchytrium endobioticum]
MTRLQKLLVFGASGRVGRHVCQYAIDTMLYEVHGFVRNHVNLQKVRPDTDRYAEQIQPFEGDVTDIQSVKEAIKQIRPDKVVSVVGPKDIREPTVLNSHAALNICQAMVDYKIRRLVLLTANGLLPAKKEEAGINDRMLYESNAHFAAWLNHACFDMQHATKIVMATMRLDYTLVCPPYMPSGPFHRTGKYRIFVDEPVPQGTVLSAPDCADFIVKVLARDDLIGHRVGIAY